MPGPRDSGVLPDALGFKSFPSQYDVQTRWESLGMDGSLLASPTLEKEDSSWGLTILRDAREEEWKREREYKVARLCHVSEAIIKSFNLNVNRSYSRLWSRREPWSDFQFNRITLGVCCTENRLCGGGHGTQKHQLGGFFSTSNERWQWPRPIWIIMEKDKIYLFTD